MQLARLSFINESALLRESKMKHNIQVTCISRESLLLNEGWHPLAHRGVWQYDPTLYPNIKVNDEVIFQNNGEVYAQGIVSEILASKEKNKYCSGINTGAFRWEPNA